MSGDIFKKAFDEASEEQRHQTTETNTKRKIQRECIEELREDLKSLFSQIPAVFEVSDLHFEEEASFKVSIQEGKNFLGVSISDNPSGSLAESVGVDRTPNYIALITQFSDAGMVWGDPVNSNFVYRDAAIEWLASELGRILGTEYESHFDYYKEMEREGMRPWG